MRAPSALPSPLPSPRSVRRAPVLAVLLALALALTGSVVAAAPAAAADPPTYVTASWSDRTPEYGQVVSVSGTVNPWRGGLLSRRNVQLLRYVGGAWRLVARAYLSSSSYSFSFRSELIGDVRYALYVPATGSAQAGVSAIATITTSRHRSWVSATVSDSRVPVRSRVLVTGRITGGQVAGRGVRIYRRIDSGLRLVASGRSDSRGHYAITLPTWHYSSDPIRVRAVATRTTLRAQTQDRQAYVVPRYDPAGWASQWRPISTSTRFRFNGCRPQIGYRVNAAGLGSTFIDEVRRVAARAEEATGIRMRYLGTTRAIPGSGSAWPSDAQVVVAYARPSQTRWNLSGSTIARGGVIDMRRARDVRGDLHEITRAGIVLDSSYSRWRSGFLSGPSRGKVLLHEWGHMMGLGHVGARSQMLYPEVTWRTRWGAGDLTGLSRLGFSGGCIRHPYGRSARTAGTGIALPATGFTTSG